MKANCNEKGDQYTCNLRSIENADLKVLKDKVKKKEIMVIPSDKGKRLTDIETELCKQVSEKAINKTTDKVINEKKVKDKQVKIEETGHALANIFNLDKSHSKTNQKRSHENLNNKSCDIQDCVELLKIHKELDDERMKKSRDLVKASNSFNTRTSNLLSDIIEGKI